MDCKFEFGLGDRVRIKSSGEIGIVTAAAIWDTGERMYYTHYVAADGRAIDAWWSVQRLESA